MLQLFQSNGGWGYPNNQGKDSFEFCVELGLVFFDVDTRVLVGQFLCHAQVLGRVATKSR